jgi:hypothetical protein
MAGSICHIISTVQLEYVWQELYSESGKFELHLDFKLPPDASASNLEINSETCLGKFGPHEVRLGIEIIGRF